MLKLKELLLGRPETRASLRRALPDFLLLSCSIIFWELLMHFENFRSFNGRFFYVVLFSVFFGLLFAVVINLFGHWGKVIALWSIQGILYIWYAAQLIYYKIFGGCISVSLIQMGGDAITSFFKETITTIFQNFGLLLFLAVPLIITGVALKFKAISMTRGKPGSLLRLAVVCVLLHVVALLCLNIGGTGAYTIYDIYHNINTGTDASVSNLGYLTTFRLELKFMMMGAIDSDPDDDLGLLDPDELLGDITLPVIPTIPPATEPSEVPVDPSSPSDPSIPTEPIVTVKDQVMQIDFDSLLAQAESQGSTALATLHKYFAAQTPTKTNDYTGLFAGKNLIFMVCESFSPEVIIPELMPTLYKLSTEGIIFENFYGTYRNVTTNGEYTACMGIFPDLSRKKSDGSFAASSTNHLPFVLGNIFESQCGIETFGYHNYVGSYYSRNKSHPNMGYACKFMNAGMRFQYSWPSSDLLMMEQSIPDYVNQERFHAYYMTFSGHYPYSFSDNPMCIKNQDAVADLSYSTAVKGYIACHLELEKAMAYLMEQLEAAGQLENTVIVMTSDHYPYGLTTKQYSELAGRKVDASFGIYENAFICWSYGMEDPIVVDEPCCTVDILPTLLNLFGFEYDSRLLIGQDILDPTAQHMAILYNGSFITDLVKFNAETGETTYLVDPSLVPENYVQIVNQIVQNKFTVSTAILNLDYYRIVLPPES